MRDPVIEIIQSVSAEFDTPPHEVTIVEKSHPDDRNRKEVSIDMAHTSITVVYTLEIDYIEYTSHTEDLRENPKDYCPGFSYGTISRDDLKNIIWQLLTDTSNELMKF